MPSSRSGPPAWLIGSVVLLAVAALLLGLDRWRRHRAPADEPAAAAETGVRPAPDAAPSLRNMALPSPQQNLFEPDWRRGIQPTVSGRPESGLFGSTRMSSSGYASFHEGVDIAVAARNARGVPTDPVLATGDGVVAYVNRSAGESNYGLYVVLYHDDPAGTIYTLYAHLAEITRELAPGRRVERGARLGAVGHTPPHIIPLERAHLHFEVGLLANDRVDQWARMAGLKNPHGAFNGRNLLGLDPLAVLADSRNPGFSLLAHLRSRPAAFRVVAKGHGRLPDYFRRHPALWEGDPSPRFVVITATDGGVPLSGRPATPEEAALLGRADAAVASVDETALGRNGRRLVIRKDGRWQLGSSGDAWLRLLMF